MSSVNLPEGPGACGEASGMSCTMCLAGGLGAGRTRVVSKNCSLLASMYEGCALSMMLT